MSEVNTPTLNKAEMKEQNRISPQSPRPRKSIGARIVLIVIMLLLMVATSVIVANIVHNRGNSVPVSGTVEKGLSAYELAVQYGYTGTMQEWLNSLSGKSAYEIAVDNGYSGSEQEWASALNASANKQGETIKTASFSSKGELLITLSDDTVLNLGVAVGADGKDGTNGIDGINGKDGVNGTNGTDGKDGVGISNITVNASGELEITLTSGTTMNLGTVKGADGANGKDGVNGADGKNGADGANGIDGKDGIGISETAVNSYGELVVTYSDGKTVNLGKVVGKDGANGTNGKDGINGQDGIGVTKTEINADGELLITYSNGDTANLGVVIGQNGQNGTDGKDGVNGVDGTDGIGISKTEINADGELIVTYSNGTTQNLGVIVGADGSNGKDGIAPQVRIDTETNEWEVSVDNGATWTSTGVKATGANGKDGKDGKDGVNGINGTNGKDGNKRRRW